MTTKIVINHYGYKYNLDTSFINEYLNKGGNIKCINTINYNKYSRLCPILIKMIEEPYILPINLSYYIIETSNVILNYNDCWDIINIGLNDEHIVIDNTKIELYKQKYKLTIENIILIIKHKNSNISYFYILDEDLLEMIFINIDIEHLDMLKLSFK